MPSLDRIHAHAPHWKAPCLRFASRCDGLDEGGGAGPDELATTGGDDFGRGSWEPTVAAVSGDGRRVCQAKSGWRWPSRLPCNPANSKHASDVCAACLRAARVSLPTNVPAEGPWSSTPYTLARIITQYPPLACEAQRRGGWGPWWDCRVPVRALQPFWSVRVMRLRGNRHGSSRGAPAAVPVFHEEHCALCWWDFFLLHLRP